MMKSVSILWHYAQARRNFLRWPKRRSLEHWQERQIQRHLRWVRARSPYYAGCFQSNDWRNFPLQNKAQLMANFSTWNTVGIEFDEAWELATHAERTRDFSATLRGLTVGLSSGTSGSRGLFLASAAERNRWVGVLLARCLQGSLGQPHRAALFLRADSTLYQNVGSRRFTFDFFDLLQPMSDHAARLRELQPTLLAAPPAALLALARLPGAREFMAPPALLLSVADVLEDSEREEISANFGTPVGQLYQATEGFLAATCAHGSLHWNEDAIVVQKAWLDEARTRYTPIITDFRRQTQPIIRYQLDDVIAEPSSPNCPCGSVFGRLGAITGRKDDVLQLPAGQGSGRILLFPDFVRRAILLAAPGVSYQVRQLSLLIWEISVSDLVASAAITVEIAQLCQSLRAQIPELNFLPYVPQPLIHKPRRVQCLL